MNYKDWLKETIGAMLHERNENINLQVYDIADARYDGGINDVFIIINGLGGTTDSDDVQVVPVQLTILSGGQYEENGNGETPYDIVFDVLKEFTKNYNKKSVLLNGFDYYKHSYMQPYPVNPLESDSGTFRLNFVVTGSLTITKDINDINDLFINGQKVPFLTARLAYITQLSPSKTMGQKITRNRIQTSALKLQIEMYNRKNVIESLLKDLRTEQINSNTPFTCVLKFSDEHTESYKMVISEGTLVSDRINPTSASYVLDLY